MLERMAAILPSAHSAGLEVVELGAPIDVLWMRVSRQPGDPNQSAGAIPCGKDLVTLDRGEYWQCAYVIPQGKVSRLMQQRGLNVISAEAPGRDRAISGVAHG